MNRVQYRGKSFDSEGHEFNYDTNECFILLKKGTWDLSDFEDFFSETETGDVNIYQDNDEGDIGLLDYTYIEVKEVEGSDDAVEVTFQYISPDFKIDKNTADIDYIATVFDVNLDVGGDEEEEV